MIYKIDVISRL